MRANFCGRNFQEIKTNWNTMYTLVIDALYSLGVESCLSPLLTFDSDIPKHAKIGISDNPNDIYIYNHTNLSDILDNGFALGSHTLFLKPTAPTPDYFSIDLIGYAANSYITYKKPFFELVDEESFYSEKVPSFIEQKCNKWSNINTLQFHSVDNVPENHILVIGQMPGDSTVTEMSFGDHWVKFSKIINTLKKDYPLVIKIHPTLEENSKKSGIWKYYEDSIKQWREENITVFSGFESIHSILPHTKVVILENSTSGLEALMYNVPIISYGYPEFHWVTFDLRHITQLKDAIDNLSWHHETLAKKWFTWYCTQYLCYDFDSTRTRLTNFLHTS